MTAVERSDYERLVEADITNRATPDERAWLRDPDRVVEFYDALRTLVGSLLDQITRAIADDESGRRPLNEDWYRRVRKYKSATEARLVEIRPLAKAENRRRSEATSAEFKAKYRTAIAAHRTAVQAADGDPALTGIADEALWALIDPDPSFIDRALALGPDDGFDPDPERNLP